MSSFSGAGKSGALNPKRVAVEVTSLPEKQLAAEPLVLTAGTVVRESPNAEQIKAFGAGASVPGYVF
jgi:hypothetical protein